MNEIPGTAIVILHNGAFGGATKRYTNLFLYLNKLYPGKFFLIVNNHIYNQLHEIYKSLPEEYIKIIDMEKNRDKHEIKEATDTPRFFSDNITDPMVIDKQYTFLRKVYWFAKNKNRQRKLFKQVEKLRAELDIKIFYGVSAGVLPLVFYFNESTRNAAVIFSNTDSWFTDVLSDVKRLWYRKYYSFNYTMENCDVVDFLSPYIAEGVKKLGVKIRDERIRISPCSFIDYSKCPVGEKKNFEIAFSSRMEPDKNPVLYLEAAKEIINKYPDVKFHILGEGTLVREIKEFIDSNNLSASVNFQFHKNPPEIFARTSVFISLQTGTNYPSQSVLEAMACGNAIIAGNRGDTKLFINESNGILIDLNKEQLVAAIESLILNKQLALRLGMNGREFVLREHTIEKYTEYFLDLLKEVKG